MKRWTARNGLALNVNWIGMEKTNTTNKRGWVIWAVGAFVLTAIGTLAWVFFGTYTDPAEF